MRTHAFALTALIVLAACGKTEATDPKRVAAIEHACILARSDPPDRCACIAKAVASQPDPKLDQLIIARMKNDQRALKQATARLSEIETNNLITRYEAVGRDAFYHCGRRRVS